MVKHRVVGLRQRGRYSARPNHLQGTELGRPVQRARGSQPGKEVKEVSNNDSAGTEDDYTTIFRASRINPDTGEREYARDVGIRGFPIRVPKPNA